MELKGKNLLVTGAASGIGRAVALQAAREGAHVIALDRDASALNGLKEGVPGVVCVIADVSSPADMDRAITAADGRLDVLCNVAGLMDRFLLVDELPENEWQRVLGVNLTGPYLLCKRAIPLMLSRGGGSIINVSSTAGIRGGRAGAAYTASKHGLIGLTLNIAATLGKEGIRCNAVCPGSTRFGSRGAQEAGVPVSERGARAIVGRDRCKPEAGTPEGVAEVILFLASEAASRVNGAVITADDGVSAY